MKDIRIGNDINVKWSIFGDGAPYILEGKDVSLYLCTPFGKRKAEGFSIVGNQITWTFAGKDQSRTGKYSLELVVNADKEGQVTTDACDFVNLVSCSCKVGGESEVNVAVESIVLTSELGVVSYDDTELRKELANKVDKVRGKGLSTEDFTTELKTKLEGLNAFDPTEINNKVNGLQNQLNTLVSGDASTSIESFNEITAFLNGIEDSESLDNIIASIESQIAAKQDTITDLETIRSGAAKGATAIQKVKTINGQSIEGEGDITIEVDVDTSAFATKEELNALQTEVINNEEVTAAAINDLNTRIGAAADTAYVDNAISQAITSTLNTEV